MAGQQPARDRVRLSIDAELVHWMHDQTAQGSLGGDSHAVELALRRLQASQAFVRDACRAKSLPYSDTQFWQLHRAEIDASHPNQAGRPGPANAHRVLGQRERVYASLAQDLLDWINGLTRGPFTNASHAAEAALRHLRAHARDGPVPGLGFHFDGDALLSAYEQLAKKRR